MYDLYIITYIVFEIWLKHCWMYWQALWSNKIYFNVFIIKNDNALKIITQCNDEGAIWYIYINLI